MRGQALRGRRDRRHHVRLRASADPPAARQFLAVPRAGTVAARLLLHCAGDRRCRAGVHRHGPHARGHDADAGQFRAHGDARHAPAHLARDHRDLRALHAEHLQRHVRAPARAGDHRRTAGTRRLLPRGLAAAAHEPIGGLCAAVALGDRSQRARLAEPDPGPRARDAPSRPAQQSAAADHHCGQRLHRRIARHDHLHLGNPLDSRASVPRRAGRRRRSAFDRPPYRLPGAALADLVDDDPSDAVAAGELRIHPADHRRRAVLRHDGLLVVRVPARVRERAVRVRCRAVADPDRDRRGRRARDVAADGHAAAAAGAPHRGALMLVDALETGAGAATRQDWPALAKRARLKRAAGQSALLAFLLIVSVPIILPYFWMVVISFTARSGGVSTQVLWTACAVIVPAVLIYSVVHLLAPSPRVRLVAGALLLVTVGALLAALVGGQLHVANYRFLWRTNIIEEIRSKATAGGQFPSVWTAFRGREAFLQGMLVLHAFPAMTLIIPIFLILHWVGLLDTIAGVIFVLATIELPFYVFVLKGFFDGVPWDIEMSAMTDGATRRQAFRMVVLPQVRAGLIAVAVFAFIRAWEEYIFVRTLLIENKNWVMSLYLFWVSDDIMGVDYGIVAAVSVFYVVPSLLLYVFCQKYLTQMTIGGIRG